MIQTPRIDYRTRDDATPHAEINALANVYRLVLDSAKQRGHNPDEYIADDTIPRNAKEVSHVDQRPG
jgi:hypothetical protein